MQTAEHLIAYQTVSLAAYQRLRETLIQQEHVFESVITEATASQPSNSRPLNSQPVSRPIKGQPANSHSINGHSVNAQEPHGVGVEGFVLMCSSTLNVLLTAVPLTVLPIEPQARRSSVELAPHLTGAQKAHFPRKSYLKGAHLKNAPLNRHLNEHPLNETSSVDVHSEAAVEYRVGLTFDDRAIAVFVDRLKNSSARALQGGIHSMSMPNIHLLSGHKTDVSEDDKIIAQKAFVLSWAKNLAASPEGDQQSSQDTLDHQVQQSLLLDQVITRIRHSLDLPAILETTVAQVREFLSSDRLVLYQFDRFDPGLGHEDPLLATLPTDAALASRLTSALNGLSLEEFSAVPAAEVTQSAISNPALSNPAISNPALSNPLVSAMKAASVQASRPTSVAANPVAPSADHAVDPAIGPTVEPFGVAARSHSGHVTYESRAASDIPSILHLSETECFEPSLPMRARYLMGQPIAVDNVETQYAQTPCLLDFLKKAQVKSKIIAPIIVQDQLWGLLIAHQCQDYRHWEEPETIFLQHIAEHLAVAITQASLYQQLRQQTVSLESCVIERTQSLHDALIAAESANITKGEFLSTMSHELRTPLTYIIGMSATLLRWSFGELNDRQRSYLTTINQSGEQLLDVINNILEFASVESGRSILDFSDLSLSELMNSIVAHHKDLAEKKQVTLSLSLKIREDEDLFRSDAKRLQQIVANLVDNAIKFTNAGGHVEVRVWREPRMAVFQIEDSGIGIPESQQDILFEKFKQLESPFQRQYAGTGLGLAMTKRLVELHGGSIQIDSQVGKGSTFTVRLPVQSESMPPQPYQMPQLDEGSKRVILLETDEENAAIACEMLTAAGYEVIWLIESDQLATQLNLLRPVMLIADLALIDPTISNIKAIQLAITALNAKVIALTNASDSAPASMAHHDILPKPIDPKLLLEKVRKLMLAPV